MRRRRASGPRTMMRYANRPRRNDRSPCAKISEVFPARVSQNPAPHVRQGRDRVLYSFAVDGKRISSFAAISRLGRNTEKRIVGYQRPEVLNHIAEIKAYLESDNPFVPNALVIAFDPVVRFEPRDRRAKEDLAVVGTLAIPI